jgi:hypothetical protein
MSALPLRTDMLSAGIDVCLVPQADFRREHVCPSKSLQRASLSCGRTPRVNPTSLLQEAFQPLPLTPKRGPVASPERLVGVRQGLARRGCGRLWSLRNLFGCRRLLAEYGLEGLTERRFHRQVVAVADDNPLELGNVRPFG